MALVKFYSCTQEKYNALTWTGAEATGISSALYFTSDTKRLYKGNTLYGGSFEYVDSLPVSGNTETLYFAANTGKISVWNGNDSIFETKFLPFETTLTNTDDTVPTSKAIKTYVDTVSGSLDQALSAAINTLDVDTIGEAGQFIQSISEVDGKISATAVNLTTANVSRTATSNVAGTSAEAAIIELGDAIHTISGDATTAGSFAKAVKDASDLLSGAIGLSAEFSSANTVKSYIDNEITAREADTAFLSGAIGNGFENVNGKTVKDAIDAVRNAAISISGAANNAVEVTENGTEKTVGLKINANDKFLSQTSDGLSAQFTLVKKVSGDTGFNDETGTIAAEYYIVDKNGTQVGDRISIAKDKFLKSANFVQGTGSGDDKIQLTFNTANGTEETVDIPLSGLFDEYTPGAGIDIQATATGFEISGKIDGNSESFLTVGAGGFKLSGVQTAINAGDTALSSAIGDRGTNLGFDEDHTVKSYIDDIQTTLSSQIGSGFGEGTTSGTVAGYINTRINSLNATLTAELSGKLDDVDENKAGEIIIAKADGKVETSGKEIGGATFGATPNADTLATEAGVSAFVNDALTGSLVWNTLP